MPLYVKVCEHCKGEFPARRSHARFCSKACRVAAHRAKKSPRWVRPRQTHSEERKQKTGDGSNPRRKRYYW